MKLSSILIANALVFAPVAFADGDSSSDAAAGFVQTLDASEGLMVLVPVNERGEELVSAAETRIVKEGFSLDADFATSFEQGEVVNTDEGLSDVDVNADSATSGWYYGNSYRNHRYYRTNNVWCPTYYYSYSPSYYYQGYRYSYQRPVYRAYPGRGGYYGYRYYYYGRGW